MKEWRKTHTKTIFLKSSYLTMVTMQFVPQFQNLLDKKWVNIAWTWCYLRPDGHLHVESIFHGPDATYAPMATSMLSQYFMDLMLLTPRWPPPCWVNISWTWCYLRPDGHLHVESIFHGPNATYAPMATSMLSQYFMDLMLLTPRWPPPCWINIPWT